MPVITTHRVLAFIGPGRILCVRASGAATRRDLRAWASAAGVEVLGEENDATDTFRLYLRQPGEESTP